MSEDKTTERDRFNAFDSYRQLGWRIDALWDELDKFNTRLRSNTARISRLKVLVEQAPEEGEEVEEEREEELAPRRLTDQDLHKLSVDQLRALISR